MHLHRNLRRIPALEVDTADQHRKLRRELGSFLDGQAVAQRVQDRSQPAVGLPTQLDLAGPDPVGETPTLDRIRGSQRLNSQMKNHMRTLRTSEMSSIDVKGK